MQLADLYWQLKRPEDAWIRGRDIAGKVWTRYAQVGLLPIRREHDNSAFASEHRETPAYVESS
jgi:hypothetical protein